MKNEKCINPLLMRDIFNYNPETGELRWAISSSRAKAGDVAGCVTSKGYIRVSVFGVRIYAHRIACAILHGQWPDGALDHSDTGKAGNRRGNLRLASDTQNCANKHVRSDSKTGIKNVTLKDGRYRSRIKINGRERHLGYYQTAEEAHEVYCLAADMLFGEFARH